MAGDGKEAHSSGLDWDELDTTQITDVASPRRERFTGQLRDRAYMIRLTGSEIGQLIPLEPGLKFVIGRSRACAIRLDDDGVSRNHCRITLEGLGVSVEDLGSTNGTWINGERVQTGTMLDGDRVRIGDSAVLKLTFHDKLEESFQQRMYDASMRDGLTGAYNRRYLLDALDKELHFARRHRTPLSILMLDVDHFKRINDTYGHVVGDQVLVTLAGVLRGVVRSEDVLARYGGEEFAVVARGIPEQGTVALAERLRSSVEKRQITLGEKVLQATISLGVAMFTPAMASATEFIAVADAALYEAKRTGRNRSCVNRGDVTP